MCGAASSNNVHAVIFHDGETIHVKSVLLSLILESDLIQLEHFLALHRHSPILTVYIHAYCVCAFIISQVQNIDFSEEQGSHGTNARLCQQAR
jgi:hypothetical protein